MEGIKQNNTLRFILPQLNEYELTESKVVISELIGCYIKDDAHPEFEDMLLLAFHPTNSTEYLELEEIFMDMSIYVDSYLKGDDILVYVLNPNTDQFKSDLELFKEGKYSEFSTALKHFIIGFWELGILEGEEAISGILYKTKLGLEEVYNKLSDELKQNTAENEYWPKPDMAEETL